MFNLASKSSRSFLVASLLLTIGCGGGDGGGAGGSGGGAGGTVGSGGRGGTTGTAGTSGGTTGTAGTGGGTAGASGTTGTGGGGGGTAGASGTTGTGGGSGGRGGATAGTTGTGGGGGGTAGASGTTGTGGGSGGRGGATAGTTGTGGGGGGTAGASGTTGAGGSAGATCAGSLVATAPPVAENRVAEAFSTSAAAGGTIMEGTYHLTSLSLYTGPGGATGPTGTNRSMTSRISGSTLEVIIISGPSGGGGTTTRLTFSSAPAGSALNVTQTCPAGGGSPALSYTASGNTLTVYSPSNGSNLAEVQVFTLGNQLCTNVFPSTGPVIAGNRVAEALPVANATGGTIALGTYHLTSYTFYTGPGGATGPNGQNRSQTIRFTAGTGGALTLEASIAATTGGTGQWLVLNGTPSGTSLVLTQICPTAGSIGTFPYSATASTFTIYNTSSNVVEAYAKQ